MTTSQDTGRRELILEAAAVVISQRGVDAARLADIAEEAGVSLGLVQHYFRHRDRLLSEVFHHELERISVAWGRFVNPDSEPLERLIDYLALTVPAGSDYASREFGPRWGFWFELWSKAHRDESIAAQVPSVYRSFAAPLALAMQDGIAVGLFASSSPVADATDRLVAMIDGLAIQTLVGGMTSGRMLTLLVDSLCSELGVSAELRAQAHSYARNAEQRFGLDRLDQADAATSLGVSDSSLRV